MNFTRLISVAILALLNSATRYKDINVYRLFCLLMSCLLLSACGTITRGLSELQKDESYETAKTTIRALRFDPPHIHLDDYKSVKDRPHQRSDFAVAIAASGGGYRAANMTAGVLLGLEKIHPPQISTNLLQEVDYISSVSGSGLAIGLYLANRYQFLQRHPNKVHHFAQAFWQGKAPLKDKLRIDYSDEMFFGAERSLALESEFGKNLLATGANKELTLGDIFLAKNAKQKALMPLWIANSAILQNANLFQFSPAVLQKYRIQGFTHDFQRQRVQHHKQRVYGYNIPFSVPMTASASFPYAVTGTTLMSRACREPCYLHLFDGGLVDNIGIYSAMEMLRQDRARYKLLIVIDAFRGNSEPFSKPEDPPGKLDLLHKVMSSSPDSFQRQMHEYIPIVAKKLLCTPGTKQVLVAYLDLYHSPKAQAVNTALWIDPEDQSLMLNTGMQLVKNNVVLNKQLPQMLRGVRVSPC